VQTQYRLSDDTAIGWLETDLSQFAGTSDLDWLSAGTSSRAEAFRAGRSSTPPGSVEEQHALALIDAARDDDLLALTALQTPRSRQRYWAARERQLRGW